MSDDSDWGDTSRVELRETLRNHVRGEVRLMQSGRDDIIVACREIHVEDEAPEDEWDHFIQYATDELERAAAENEAEQTSWPSKTDCDRLDLVEADLRDRGILLWQLSPCCDTCTGSELPDRIAAIEERHPGFRVRVRGYAFFIDQNMAGMLSKDTTLNVYLGYGWYAPDNSIVAQQDYELKALSVASEVCDCLRAHGLEPEWNGGFAKKIGVSINWQRRTMLL